MPRRRLTPEERELWRRIAATASPLREDLHEPEPVVRLAPAPPEVRPRIEPPPPMSLPAPPPVAPGRATFDLAPDPHAALGAAHPHMDRRRFEKMRRGRLDPEARLDLHGMTAERAHGALRSFILTAHGGGMRLVLVITGRGRPGDANSMTPHRQGVLRHSLPHWLAAPPLVSKVLQVAPAHIRHGGGGAFYVYLRRQR